MVDRFGPTSVRIDCGNGGSPDDVVNAAEQKTRNTDYDVVVIAIDSDVEISDYTRMRIAKLQFHLVTFDPCLECIMLDILDDAVPGHVTCDTCKDRFHERYIIKRKKTHKSYYERDFGLHILERARGRVMSLNMLIGFMLDE
ncbi:MAG: hypothetical protein ACC655_04965 [Rhodothermia bacterium]